MNATILAGHHDVSSRTVRAAIQLANTLGFSAQDPQMVLAGRGFLEPRPVDDQHKSDLAAVRASRLLIVASPIFKASYPGILKIFLDHLATSQGLAGVIAVPMMIGGSDRHYMVPELLLKPLLVELGACCPTQALFIREHEVERSEIYTDWARQWKRTLDVLCSES